MNHLTDDTQAVLLLCARFSADSQAKPLGTVEYNKLVRWLLRDDVKLRPGDLLRPGPAGRAEREAGFEPGRLDGLLRRGGRLGFAVEEWDAADIWALSRSDADYPRRYREHLRDKCPPILFGIGDRGLLRGGGLAIVGSRDVDAEGERFTRDVAGRCAAERMTVVSGGARGVDQVSMDSAFQSGGTVIGVLSENLLRKSLQRDVRRALAGGSLLLISPYHPKSPFSVGNAMGRNKLIYAMADYGLVVSAAYNGGGTWAGAAEELRRPGGIPVFVRMDGEVPPGNGKLLEKGARRWPDLSGGAGLREALSAAAAEPSPAAGGGARAVQDELFPGA